MPALLTGNVVHIGNEWEVKTTHPRRARCTNSATWAVEHDIEVPALSVGRPSLEDTYLELVAANIGPAAGNGAVRPGNDRLCRARAYRA